MMFLEIMGCPKSPSRHGPWLSIETSHGDLGPSSIFGPVYCSGWPDDLAEPQQESHPQRAQRSEVITESTAIDDQAGLLMWWRHVESLGVKLVKNEWELNP